MLQPYLHILPYPHHFTTALHRILYTQQLQATNTPHTQPHMNTINLPPNYSSHSRSSHSSFMIQIGNGRFLNNFTFHSKFKILKFPTSKWKSRLDLKSDRRGFHSVCFLILFVNRFLIKHARVIEMIINRNNLF